MQSFIWHSLSKDMGVLKFRHSDFEFIELFSDLRHNHKVNTLTYVVAFNCIK